MIFEIVIAGLILMAIWWLFKTGLIWPLIIVLVAGLVWFYANVTHIFLAKASECGSVMQNFFVLEIV